MEQLTKSTTGAHWTDQELTHMPFLCPYRLGFLLIFSRSKVLGRRPCAYSPTGARRIWRLAWTDCNPRVGRYNPVQSIHTGLAPFEMECSPCLTQQAGEVHLSFVGTARHGRGNVEHHLFRMSGTSIENLKPAIRVSQGECYAGFWRPDQMATASGKNGVIHLKGLVNGKLETGFQELLRISYRSEFPQQILVTGRVPNETRHFRGTPVPRTVVYDISQRQLLGEILINGDPVYKPSLCGEWLSTAQPGHHEARESLKIVFSDDYTVEPAPLAVRFLDP